MKNDLQPMKTQILALLVVIGLLLVLSASALLRTRNIIVATSAMPTSIARESVWVPLVATPPLPGFYVAPQGSPNGNGSWKQPWDLATALAQPDSVHPGATIWLRGGTYQGSFTSWLTGSEVAPIIVRQFPGERATIDRHSIPGEDQPALTVFGAWTTFWGFEVMDSNPDRVTKIPGEHPGPGGGPLRPNGLQIHASHTKFINLVVHDAGVGIGLWKDAEDAEVYGSIIYNNGWQGPDKGHEHGIYTNNITGTKHIEDNIIFDQFHAGIHAYSEEEGTLQGFYFEGNASFNNGSISREETAANILVGGGGPVAAEQVTLAHNYTYHSNPTKVNVSLDFGEVPNEELTCQDNYFVGGDPVISTRDWNPSIINNNTLYSSGQLVALALPNSIDMTTYRWDKNIYFESKTITPFSFRDQARTFIEWREETGFDQNSRYVLGRPTGSEVFVRPNKYEPGRANIIVYNWDLRDTMDVDVSKVLTVGSRYEVRNVQDYFGAPVVSGTYNGTPIHLPMIGIQPPVPVGGWVTAPSVTGPEFNVFILTRTGSVGT
jgi:Right handed beta helix region